MAIGKKREEERNRGGNRKGKGKKQHNNPNNWTEFIRPMVSGDEIEGPIWNKKTGGKRKCQRDGRVGVGVSRADCWAFRKKLGLSSREVDERVASVLGDSGNGGSRLGARGKGKS